MSKYGVLSGPYYGDTPYVSVFSPNAEKYGPEKTPYFDTFHAVDVFKILVAFLKSSKTLLKL